MISVQPIWIKYKMRIFIIIIRKLFNGNLYGLLIENLNNQTKDILRNADDLMQQCFFDIFLQD